MKDEKITFDNLLSWKDVINLGNNGSYYPVVNKKLLRYCCNNDYYKKLLEEDYIEYLEKPLFEEVPGFIKQSNMFDFPFKIYADEDGTVKAKLSFIDFIYSLVDKCFVTVLPNSKTDPDTYIFIDKDGNKKLLNLREYIFDNQDNLKETMSELVKDQKRKIHDILDYYGSHDKFDIKCAGETIEANSNYFVDMRSNINWFMKNYDKLEEFFNRDFPLEALRNVNKDKFLFSQAADAFENVVDFMMTVTGEDDPHEKIVGKEDNIYNSFVYVNNYLLMVDYLRKNGNMTYNQSLHYYFDNEEFYHSLQEVEKGYKEIMNDFDELELDIKKDFKFYESYEDILSNRLKDAYKKIENEKMVRNIKLNFELLASGERITINKGEGPSKKYNRTESSNEKRQAKLKHDYDVVDEKMEYFDSKKPLIQALGINEFKGYFANFYPNGTVILDKYFKEVVDRKGKVSTLPAVGEAIYVMNYKEFGDLSLLKKMELIREKVEFNNPNIQRVYHTSSGSWKNKMDKIIDGPGYGELDLGLLDMLVTGVSSNTDGNKQLIK